MKAQLSPDHRVAYERVAYKRPPAALLSNVLLRGLSKDLYSTVRSTLEPVSIKKGTVLFSADENIDHIYFPETTVFSERYRKSLKEGRLIEIGLIGNNGAAGLIQAFTGRMIANYTIAIKSGTAMKLGIEEYEYLIEAYPEFRSTVSSYFGLFSQNLCQRPACVLFHSSKQRFCTWLVQYLHKSSTMTLRATHNEIAQCLGIYRPNVTLLTRELSEEKLIACSRGSLTILDEGKLQIAACGCY